MAEERVDQKRPEGFDELALRVEEGKVSIGMYFPVPVDGKTIYIQRFIEALKKEGLPV